MRSLIRAAVLSTLGGAMVALFVEGARAADGFGQRLEQVLNGGNSAELAALIAGDQSTALERRYARFTEEFPQARWSVRSADSLKDGRSTYEVTVNGVGEADGLRYRLEASQRLALSIQGGRILDQQLLEEQSLLRSGDKPLPVTLEIPDAVLTGSRYDVDVIFEQPLGPSIVAGGLIPLTPQEVANQTRPNLRLEPMGGGGLFKTVQAPQTPGSQFWAAMLVHPDGVVTVTKRVRVVGSKQELDQ